MPHFYVVLKRSQPGGKSLEIEYSRFFGPFNSVGELQRDLNERFHHDTSVTVCAFEGQILSPTRHVLEKPETEKTAPDPAKFTQVSPDTWICNDCQSTVLAVRVAHPVHDRIFPGSGGGEVRTSWAPYCPRCNVKPSSSGAPIVE